MRGYHGKRHAGAAALAAFLLAGCHGLHHKSVAVAEPGLSESGVAVAPAARLSWFDRHPLFARPAEIFHTTPTGPVVKTAAAAVIGVPVGVVHELKQIVMGAPPDAHY